MGQAALSNEKQSALFFVSIQKPLHKAAAPPQSSPSEGTEKVPFFYDQNGKCLRFVTSLSANRLK